MTRPLKILFVADSAGGGAGIAAQRLLLGLRDVGVDIRFLVFRQTEGIATEWSEPLTLQESRGLVRKAWKVVGGARRVLGDWARWRRGRRRDRFFGGRPDSFEITTLFPGTARLDQHPWFQWADVIHLHWVSGFLSPAQRWKEKPWVISLHDANPFTAVCHFPADCTRFETGCQECPQLAGTRNPRWSARVFDLKKTGYAEDGRITLHAPSRWIAELAARSRLTRAYPSAVLPNVFPTDVFRPLDRVACRDWLRLPRDRKLALFVAGHVGNSRKGFSWFLKLAEARPDWDFVVVGGGALPDLPDNCRFLGRLTDLRLMAAAYSAADVFVSTALQDNVPATIAESQLCGTPVIGFSVGGQPEMIEQGQTGYLSSPVGLDSLERGLAWFEAESPSRKNIARFALDRWNLDRLRSEWLRFYRELV